MKSNYNYLKKKYTKTQGVCCFSLKFFLCLNSSSKTQSPQLMNLHFLFKQLTIYLSLYYTNIQ